MLTVTWSPWLQLSRSHFNLRSTLVCCEKEWGGKSGICACVLACMRASASALIRPLIFKSYALICGGRPPSSHHITLILFLPLSYYLVPLILCWGQTASRPLLPAWSNRWMDNIMKFATHLSQRITGRLAFQQGGEGWRGLLCVWMTSAPATVAVSYLDWVVSPFRKVLLMFCFAWIYSGNNCRTLHI